MLNIVCYNIGMGAKPNVKLIADRRIAYEAFKHHIGGRIKTEGGKWVLCLQEIYRYGDDSKNQVLRLRDYLAEQTGEKWHSNTTTHEPYDHVHSAVAIISNCKRQNEIKNARWLLTPAERTHPCLHNCGNGTFAYKIKINRDQNVWIVTTHFLRAGLDPNGTCRVRLSRLIYEKIQELIPQDDAVLMCGDFNVVDVSHGSYGIKPTYYDEVVYNNTAGLFLANQFSRGRDYTSGYERRTRSPWTTKLNGNWYVIDYMLFRRGNSSLEMEAPSSITFQDENKKHVSDHNALFTRIVLR